MTEPAGVTIAAPDAWLAAAAEHRRSHPGRAVDANRPEQVDRALRFLWQRAHSGDDATPARAAAIVNALPGAPAGERILGVRDTDVAAPELPPDARELLERLGADIPVPVIEPTAVTAPVKTRAKGRAAKPAAKDAADGAETEAGT
jgi:hypothetical protein